MLKLGWMRRQTGVTFIDPSNIETNDKLVEFATFDRQTSLALTKHPHNGHCTAKAGEITTRLITSWLESVFDQELTSIGQGASLEKI